MSLIVTSGMDGSYAAVHCQRCGEFCFREEFNVVSDMALRDVGVYCWHCDPQNSETVPAHLYYLDDHFLLGLGERSFLAEWKTDDLEIRQEELKLTPITASAYYALKTGDIRLVTPLSSWTNLHTKQSENGVNE